MGPPLDGRLMAVAGPDALVLDTPVATDGEDHTTVARFTVSAGGQVPFVLSWLPSTGKLPDPAEARRHLEATEAWWQAWSARCIYRVEWRDAVSRSCATLKALTYGPTGGIVAALTTSLPERLGGVRNWDYRYVWLRDATLTLQSHGDRQSEEQLAHDERLDEHERPEGERERVQHIGDQSEGNSKQPQRIVGQLEEESQGERFALRARACSALLEDAACSEAPACGQHGDHHGITVRRWTKGRASESRVRRRPSG